MRVFLISIWLLLSTTSTFSQTYIDSVKTVIDNTNNVETKINSYNNLSHYRLFQSFFESKAYAQKAINLADSIDRNDLLGKAYHMLSLSYWAHGWYDSALYYKDRTIALLSENNLRSDLAEHYNKMGLLYFYTARYDSAIFNIEKSISLFEELKDTTALSRIHNNLGIIYDVRGEFQKSTPEIIIGLRLQLAFDNIKDQENRKYDNKPLHKSEVILNKFLEEKKIELDRAIEKNDYLAEGKVHSDISWIYSRNDMPDEAIASIKKSIQIYEDKNETIPLADAYRDLAEEYQGINEYESAIENFLKARDLNLAAKSMIRYGAVCSQISNAYLLSGNYTESLKSYKQTLDVATSLGHVKSYIIILLKTSEVFKKLNNLDSSVFYANKSYNRAKNFGLKTEIMNAAKGLSELYILKNDSSRALKYIIESAEISEEFSKENNTREILRMEEEFKAEEQSKEIASLRNEQKYQEYLFYIIVFAGAFIFIIAVFIYRRYLLTKRLNSVLRKQSDEIDEKNSVLQKLVKEKEVLIGEVHHRVKNNLQVISSLLRLKSSKIKDKSALRIISEGQDRINTVAMIHENLFQKGLESKIELKDYIQEICKSLLISFDMESEIHVKYNLQKFEIDFDRAVYIGLIVNELISNSLKHAFSSKQKDKCVEVSLTTKEFIQISVSDNGNGYVGFENSKETSGIGIVKALLKYLRASFSVDTTNKGFKLDIEIPFRN